MKRPKVVSSKLKPSFTPKLRFPEFRDAPEWQTKVGGDLFANRKEAGINGLPIYSVTTHDGMVPRASFDRDFYDIADPAGNQKVCKGDIAYNMMRMWQGAQGVASEDCMVSPAYVVLAPRDGVSAEFFAHLFKLPQSLDLLTATSRGLTKDRLRLYFDDFSRMPLCVPEYGEQNRVASCLASIDELIAAQSNKLEALQAHKKSLTLQLFPIEGETLPRLRFSEFRYAPEWEEASLGQCVDFESGGTPSKQNPEFWNGSIPWVSAKDMKRLFLEDAEDHITPAAAEDGAKQAPAGTVLMLTRGMTLFKDVPICVLRRPMSFNQDVKALRAKGDVTQRFLPFLLLANKQRLLEMVDSAGHGTGRLNTDELKSLELSYPRQAEQMRIVDCLELLETLVAAQTEKLSALKTHKKGLVQKLFPCPAEAES